MYIIVQVSKDRAREDIGGKMEQKKENRKNRKKYFFVRKTAVWLVLLCLCIGVVAPVRCADAATNKSPYYIKVNRKQNCVTVYGLDKNGKYTVPVKAMTCSVGVTAGTNNETPTGTFSIYSKYRWRPLYYGVYGQYACRFNGPIMFHSVPYTSMSPSSLQYEEFNKLGKAASHGCVRLSCEDARWIYKNCPNGTKVTVYEGNTPGPLGKPETIKIAANSKYKNWDPTDIDEKNPWRKVAPKFTGLKNTMTVERCSSKSRLLSGVTAVNFKGQKVKVTIKGSCDLKKEGSYKLTYQAKDYLGNTNTKKVTVVVKDTTKPTVYRNRVKLTVDDALLQNLAQEEGLEITSQDLSDYMCGFVTAKDSGAVLDKEAVTAVVEELYEAYKTKTYGTYEVRVYATDKAGNRSVTKVITVFYNAPEEDTENKDDTEDQPGESSGETTEMPEEEKSGLIGAII